MATVLQGKDRSHRVKPGDLIGAECVNDTEPFIVCEVVKGFAVWKGEPSRSWMGMIKADDEYITCKKYERRNSESLYAEIDKQFYLLAGDTRIIFQKHRQIERERSSKRHKGVVAAKIYLLDDGELEMLKNRVYIRNRDGE